MEKKIFLSRNNRQLMGVCGGVAEYLNVDPTAVRVAWVIGSAFTGFVFGVGIYFACAFIIPEAPRY